MFDLSFNDFILVIGDTIGISVNDNIFSGDGKNIPPDLCIMQAYHKKNKQEISNSVSINNMLEDILIFLYPNISYLGFVQLKRLIISHDFRMGTGTDEQIMHESFIPLDALYSKMIDLKCFKQGNDFIQQISNDNTLTKNEFLDLVDEYVLPGNLLYNEGFYFFSNEIEDNMDKIAHKFMQGILSKNYLTSPETESKKEFIQNWIKNSKRDMNGIHGLFSICHPVEEGWIVREDTLYYGFMKKTGLSLPKIKGE